MSKVKKVRKPTDIRINDIKLQMDDFDAWIIWMERDHMSFDLKNIHRLARWLTQASAYLKSQSRKRR